MPPDADRVAECLREIEQLMIRSDGGSLTLTFNAQTGDGIAREQSTAENKEQVLRALGDAALELRKTLGESLQSIQKFAAPVEQATTSSLDALKAFSLGVEQQLSGKYIEAIPFLRRATEIDPTVSPWYAPPSAR